MTEKTIPKLAPVEMLGHVTEFQKTMYASRAKDMFAGIAAELVQARACLEELPGVSDEPSAYHCNED